MIDRMMRMGMGWKAWALALLLGLLPLLAVAQAPPTHTVAQGETLFGIARQYDLSVEELQRLNDLDSPAIRVGQELIVGAADGEEAGGEAGEENATMEETVATAEAPEPEASPAPGRYRLDADARLFAVARTLGVSVDTLVALNAETLGGPLQEGQELRIPEMATATTTTTEHTVNAGENLTRIARQYDVSLEALREANSLRSDVLQVGQVLEVPGQQAAVELPEVFAEGPVLRYPRAFSGRLTASGAAYDPEAYTVSHPSLAFGTLVLLHHPDTGQEVIAEVNDRGPLDDAYAMEVSHATAEALGIAQESAQALTIYVLP
jgi:LysM repeat protein